MNHLYITDCSPLLDERTLAKALPLLDSARRGRVQRLSLPEKKAQCAAAGLLLTHLFGQDGTPPPLFHGSRGKPYLYGREDAFFSLSHSGTWVVCATAGTEIGMDAQVKTPYNPKVAARCFTTEEVTWLEQSPEERFTPLWTAKEAYLKHTGFGLVLPMSSFTVPCPAAGPDEANHCHWWNTQMGDLHITVCCGTPWQAEPEILSIEKSLLR